VEGVSSRSRRGFAPISAEFAGEILETVARVAHNRTATE